MFTGAETQKTRTAPHGAEPVSVFCVRRFAVPLVGAVYRFPLLFHISLSRPFGPPEEYVNQGLTANRGQWRVRHFQSRNETQLRFGFAPPVQHIREGERLWRSEHRATGLPQQRRPRRVRADVVIWRTAQDKADAKTPLIVVECKADNITIKAADYAQGEAYSLYCNAPFFVTHNNRETRYWRTRKERMPGHCEEIENIPHADASDRDIQESIAKLRAFKEDEFADLLHSCHNVIRNREHMDPPAAFDEIASVLFVKVWVEREMKAKRRRVNLLTADYLDEPLGTHPLNDLFHRTKDAYAEDRIFASDDRINVKPATGREIVRLLERYNLSDTSEDVKGIAFERCERRSKSAAGGGPKAQRPGHTYPAHCGASTSFSALRQPSWFSEPLPGSWLSGLAWRLSRRLDCRSR